MWIFWLMMLSFGILGLTQSIDNPVCGGTVILSIIMLLHGITGGTVIIGW